VPRSAPLIGYYGDDFTGATDTLATATQQGLRTLLFLRVPTAQIFAAAGPLDCVGIAGTARSLNTSDMTRELMPVAQFFATLGASVIHYKTCSTFDSAPETGSIGHAVSILRPLAGNAFLPIVGGQPNLNRYCLFGNLFAAAGTGGLVHRIDRHPTMSVHPVTPMGEADLRQHLARQGLTTILSLDYTRYAKPDHALHADLTSLLAHCPDAILLDVSRQEDLPVIGRLLWHHAASAPLLAVGPSSVVDALAHGRADITAPSDAARVTPAQGPVFVLSGSLSPVTRKQLQAASCYTHIEIDAARLAARDHAHLDSVLTQVLDLLGQGRHVLADTASLAGAGSPAVAPRALAQACGDLVLRVVQATKLRRIGIAGGDTSSYALKALDIWGLSYRGALAPGVALCRAHASDPRLDGIEIMLKGGQMGPPDIFERLLRGG
jgi:uncharacterized protein YgbK (DUF1537 family)